MNKIDPKLIVGSWKLSLISKDGVLMDLSSLKKTKSGNTYVASNTHVVLNSDSTGTAYATGNNGNTLTQNVQWYYYQIDSTQSGIFIKNLGPDPDDFLTVHMGKYTSSSFEISELTQNRLALKRISINPPSLLQVTLVR
ncbi:MAG: hypothetical protein U0Y96_07170 [Candidatus Kapaibacterium sp.]